MTNLATPNITKVISKLILIKKKEKSIQALKRIKRQ